jgi:hypothetical protein
MSSKKKLRIKGNIDDLLNKHNLNSKTFNKKSKTNDTPVVVEVIKQNKEEKVKPIKEFEQKSKQPDTPK